MPEGDKNAGVAEDEDNEGYDGGEDEPGPNLVVMSVEYGQCPGRRHSHLFCVLIRISGLYMKFM